MDASRLGSGTRLESVGEATCSPFCHVLQSQASHLRISNKGSHGSGNGCPIDKLAGARRLRVSPDLASAQSTEKSQTRPTQAHSNHSLLGSEGVVPRPSQPRVRSATGTGSRKERSPPTKRRTTSPLTRRTLLDRVALMRSKLRARHVSAVAIDLALRGKRDSTNNIYNIRWRIWAIWCLKQGFSPLHPREEDLVNFLSDLSSTKDAAPSTLLGYRSAVTSTIALIKGTRSEALSNSVTVAELVKGVKNARVRRAIQLPQWDLFVVLDFLRGDTFEPLRTTPLRNLTFKFTFLLSLACARRVSELHALSGLSQDISFARDKSHVTLCFLPEFRAEKQEADSESPTVSITSLTFILNQNDEDRLLCPVRALRIYLQRTSAHRGNKRRLLVSYNTNYCQDIGKVTISRWIAQVVKDAYSEAGMGLLNGNPKAKEIRAISTSLAHMRGLPLKAVMKAAYWSSESTFIKFYLRDLGALRRDDTYGIASIAVAQGSVAL